jgi:hypothetical protein
MPHSGGKNRRTGSGAGMKRALMRLGALASSGAAQCVRPGLGEVVLAEVDQGGVVERGPRRRPAHPGKPAAPRDARRHRRQRRPVPRPGAGPPPQLTARQEATQCGDTGAMPIHVNINKQASRGGHNRHVRGTGGEGSSPESLDATC